MNTLSPFLRQYSGPPLTPSFLPSATTSLEMNAAAVSRRVSLRTLSAVRETGGSQACHHRFESETPSTVYSGKIRFTYKPKLKKGISLNLIS